MKNLIKDGYKGGRNRKNRKKRTMGGYRFMETKTNPDLKINVFDKRKNIFLVIILIEGL